MQIRHPISLRHPVTFESQLKMSHVTNIQMSRTFKCHEHSFYTSYAATYEKLPRPTSAVCCSVLQRVAVYTVSHEELPRPTFPEKLLKEYSDNTISKVQLYIHFACSTQGHMG